MNKTINMVMILLIGITLGGADGSCRRNSNLGDNNDAGADDSDDNNNTTLCEYDGLAYQVGDTFDAVDGCNTCTCESDGSVSCTELGCAPDCPELGCQFGFLPDEDGDGCSDGCRSELVCEYNRVTYNTADSFPAVDGCNTCTCESDGSVSCTELGCAPDCPELGCQFGFLPDDDGDGCSDGCREEPSGCLYNGVNYEIDDSFAAADGCNTCFCDEQGIGCTEMFCGGDKANLCAETGGVWHDEASNCGDWSCGLQLECEAIIPGCQCSPDSNFVEGIGCQVDEQC